MKDEGGREGVVMTSRCFFFVIGLAIGVAGCNRYSYPANKPPTASSINQDIIASHGAPKVAGVANLEVTGMVCQGKDYVIKVHYDQGFEGTQFLGLQYQILPKSANDVRVFTQPTGMLEIKPPTSSGDVTLTIPGDNIPGKDSDVLLRLKLKTLTILEATSPQEQVHISETCR